MKKRNVYFWRRSLAFLIDIFIIGLLTSPLQGLINKRIPIPKDLPGLIEFFSNPNALEEHRSFLLLISLLIFLIALAYWSILESTLKQSLGKMIVNIKVESKNFLQCVIRNLSKALLFFDMLFFIFFIDIIVMIINKEHLRLFEKLSKTRVVR